MTAVGLHAMSRATIRAMLAVASATAAVSAGTASAASFRATISGKQELTWKLDGTTGDCEIRHGVGDGTVKFSFRSPKPAFIVATASHGLTVVGSITTIAKGSIAGSFTDTVQTACPGFAPSDPFTQSATGCGPTRFGIRVDVSQHGAYLYLTGPNVPLGPVSIAQIGGDCPFPLGDSGWVTSLDRTACGDGTQLWKRSWGVASAGGAGLLASRTHMAPRQLLHVRKGRKTHVARRVVVDCTAGSQYTGGVKITGKLNYTLTLKRVS
jgi:hypothetical protein